MTLSAPGDRVDDQQPAAPRQLAPDGTRGAEGEAASRIADLEADGRVGDAEVHLDRGRFVAARVPHRVGNQLAQDEDTSSLFLVALPADLTETTPVGGDRV